VIGTGGLGLDDTYQNTIPLRQTMATYNSTNDNILVL